MPYIKDDDRCHLEQDENGQNQNSRNCGELNYLITLLVINFLEEKGLSYQTCNDIVGALDNAKDEFKRRVQNPYEDRKIRENGDVYPEKFAPRIQ